MLTSEMDKIVTFIKDFEDQQKILNNKAPQWLKDFRKQGLTHFTQLGIPTIRDEEWKYTNISPIVQRTYELTFEDGQLLNTEPLERYCDPKEFNLVFVNGIFSQKLSQLKSLPQGVHISTLQEAIVSHDPELEKLLKKYDAKSESAFVALNRALTQDGAYIKIADKVIVNKLIHIIHITNTSDKEIFSSPHTLITLGKSSEAKVLESHLAFSNEMIYFVNALTDIFLGENATLWYCKAQSESLKAFHIGATRIWEERNSNFNGFSLDLGGRIARNNLDVALSGEGGNAILDGLYCVHGGQLVDNHTCVDHREPNATSNQLYKGILNGASRAVFNGKIIVRPIAQKTNSYQLNKNILLGKECLVDTKPQLEIFADDVKCTHGATIGQLNEDEIFYLRTRAIPKRTAIKMLSRGFVDDVLQRIPDESVVRKLNQLLEPIFAAL